MNIEKELIYTIKIANGDEIVTKVVDIDENGNYIVSKPLTVVPGPQGIQMIMSLFTANPDKNYLLNKSQCSMIALARDEVRDSYIEATTGIKPVSSKILMG
jgi:hypothetical protein